MNTVSKNKWFALQLLLLINAFLIAIIILLHAGTHQTKNNEEPAGNATPVNADALKSITIKLMY